MLLLSNFTTVFLIKSHFPAIVLIAPLNPSHSLKGLWGPVKTESWICFLIQQKHALVVAICFLSTLLHNLLNAKRLRRTVMPRRIRKSSNTNPLLPARRGCVSTCRSETHREQSNHSWRCEHLPLPSIYNKRRKVKTEPMVNPWKGYAATWWLKPTDLRASSDPRGRLGRKRESTASLTAPRAGGKHRRAGKLPEGKVAMRSGAAAIIVLKACCCLSSAAFGELFLSLSPLTGGFGADLLEKRSVRSLPARVVLWNAPPGPCGQLLRPAAELDPACWGGDVSAAPRTRASRTLLVAPFDSSARWTHSNLFTRHFRRIFLMFLKWW